MRAPDGYTLENDGRVFRFVAASPDRIREEVGLTGIAAAGEVVCAVPSSFSFALFGKGGERVLRRGVAALFAVLAANPRDVTITQRALGAGGRDDARLAILDRLFTQHAPPGAVKPRFARVLDLGEPSARADVTEIVIGDFGVDVTGAIAVVRPGIADPAALADAITACKHAGVRWLDVGPNPAYARFGGELVRLPNVTLAAQPAVKSPSWLQRFTAR